jgi:glycosyltransferase involved in cell wall biosynthesis
MATAQLSEVGPRRRTATASISVVLPCLNEEQSVGQVVDDAFAGLRAVGALGEVIVVDNGSTDRSAAIARAHGATVVREPRRGYGSAYRAGLAAASGDVIVLADADGTYDVRNLRPLLDRVAAGSDLVLGSRLRGTIAPKAMPWSHRWIGNPILTGLLNLLFRAHVSDAHCGLRAIRRDALERLDLETTGMEFASEMVVKAAKSGLRIDEVPIAYGVRGGESKLSRFSDAWRHIRFLLVHSPTFLFVVPGFALFLLGLVVLFALAPGPLELLGRRWEIHTAVVASVATLVGAQIVQLGLFARTYAIVHLGERDGFLERLGPRVRLETGLIAGGVLLLGGMTILGGIAAYWFAHGFGTLHA